MKKGCFIKGCFLLIIIILLFILVISTIVYMSGRDLTFTPDRWDKEIMKRERMLDDLLKNYDLGSMSYDEVLETLGTHSAEISDGSIVYDIGESRLWGMIWLVIEFDEEGNVERYYRHWD